MKNAADADRGNDGRPEDLADEMDLASADYNQNLSFRLRGRERHLLSKIEGALSGSKKVKVLRRV